MLVAAERPDVLAVARDHFRYERRLRGPEVEGLVLSDESLEDSLTDNCCLDRIGLGALGEYKTVEATSGLVLHAGDDVAIDIERDGDRRVTEHLLDNLR